MLHEHHLMSAPRAVKDSIKTAVCTVMWREPAILAPLNGCSAPNSVLQAISPGISASARSISRRPKSAWLMSLTLYCTTKGESDFQLYWWETGFRVFRDFLPHCSLPTTNIHMISHWSSGRNDIHSITPLVVTLWLTVCWAHLLQKDLCSTTVLRQGLMPGSILLYAIACFTLLHALVLFEEPVWGKGPVCFPDKW